MGATKLKNNISTVLGANLLTTVGTMTVATGRGSDWADCNGTDWCYTTLESPTGGQREIVKVTNRSGDVLTITRGQDDTSDPGATWDTTTIVERRLNKLTLDEYTGLGRGSIAMHATTMDLWAQPNIIDGTSTAVTITAIANAPQAGARRVLYPVAASVITNGATFAVDGAANATAAAGDAWEFEAITTSTYKVHITKKDGASLKPPTARVGSTTSHATPTINTDNVDIYKITAQTEAITSMTTNLSGTPTDGQVLIIQITGTAARAITWGASFEASTVALPTTTVTTAMLSVGLLWNAVTSKWRCMAAV